MDMKERLIVALDVSDFKTAKEKVETLGDVVKFYKVGVQLFTSVGPDIVKYLKDKDKKVFLDLKLHDIPNVVSKTVGIAAMMGVNMITLHTLGGFELMESSQKMSWAPNGEQVIILGVTILTSLDQAFLNDFLGVNKSIDDEIIQLAMLAKSAGIAGVISSPLEISKIKSACGGDFLVVTPGIRPKGFDTMDHTRTATPEEAIRWGADYIVVGRPIISSDDPRGAAIKIIEEMENGLS
uniref:Orotidine 5'-phosphate decarboxylase n=1 Tax=candidate division WOR-3 bacterium TaxID=2052148 RepID=A0A7C4YF84_UNCW3